MKEIIVGRQGNQRVPITEPTVSRRHCRLVDNGDGSYTLENLSQTACTYVDGRQILKTTIRKDDVIQLGATFRIKVSELLPVGADATAPPKEKEFSIRPLKEIWTQYDQRQTEMKESQRTTNLLRSMAPMFTMGSGAIAAIAKGLEWDDSIFVVTIIMTIIGLCIMVYAFMQGYQDNSIEDNRKLTRWMQDNYVCPNPECRHFVGMKDYNILRQDKKCPYCGCKYKE